MKYIVLGTLLLASNAVYSQTATRAELKEQLKETNLSLYFFNGYVKKLKAELDALKNKKHQPEDSMTKKYHQCTAGLGLQQYGIGGSPNTSMYGGKDADNKPSILFNLGGKSAYSFDMVEAMKKLETLNPKQHVVRANSEIFLITLSENKKSWNVRSYDGSVPLDAEATIELKKQPNNNLNVNTTMQHQIRAGLNKMVGVAKNDSSFRMSSKTLFACKDIARMTNDKVIGSAVKELAKKSTTNKEIAHNIKKEKQRVLTGTGGSGSCNTGASSK